MICLRASDYCIESIFLYGVLLLLLLLCRWLRANLLRKAERSGRRGACWGAVRVHLQPQLRRGRHRQTGHWWWPGRLRVAAQHKRATSSRGLSYVRGSPVPDAHFRRDLADRTGSQARGRLVKHYRYALPSRPGGNPCTRRADDRPTTCAPLD